MAKLRYNFSNPAPVHYKKKKSGKSLLAFFGLVLLFFCAWGIYELCFGKDGEKTAETVEKTAAPVSAPVEKTAETSVKAAPEKKPAPAKKIPQVPAVDPQLAADASVYPLGPVSIDQVPRLRNAETNKLFAKALSDTDYQTAKTLLLKEINTLSNRSSIYFRQLGKYMRALNMKIVFDAVPGGKNEKYIIQPGDSLSRIAVKFNFPVDAIFKANKLKSGTIYPGNKLTVYKGDWRIEVSKIHKLLYVYDGKDLFAIYDIGIGKEGRTPKGEFILVDKIEHPSWYSPDGRIVAYGEKENVLGTHWLKLDPAGDTDKAYIGYGIHGTWDEGSITKSLSNGCIRMTNDEVGELFIYIPRKTPVKIF